MRRLLRNDGATRMRNRRRNIRVALGVGFAFVAAWLALPLILEMLLPKRTQSTTVYYCETCGVKICETSDGVVGESGAPPADSNYEETALSHWFQEHFGTDDKHQWHFNHSSSRTYLGFAGWRVSDISRESGCAVTP